MLSSFRRMTFENDGSSRVLLVRAKFSRSARFTQSLRNNELSQLSDPPFLTEGFVRSFYWRNWAPVLCAIGLFLIYPSAQWLKNAKARYSRRECLLEMHGFPELDEATPAKNASSRQWRHSCPASCKGVATVWLCLIRFSGSNW